MRIFRRFEFHLHLTSIFHKVLYEQMPVIYIYAINTTGGKDPKLYESPIYRKPGRKEVSFLFILRIAITILF